MAAHHRARRRRRHRLAASARGLGVNNVGGVASARLGGGGVMAALGNGNGVGGGVA